MLIFSFVDARLATLEDEDEDDESSLFSARLDMVSQPTALLHVALSVPTEVSAVSAR